MLEIKQNFGEVSIVEILQMLQEEVIDREEARGMLFDTVV